MCVLHVCSCAWDYQYRYVPTFPHNTAYSQKTWRTCVRSLTHAHTRIQRGNTASHEKGLGVAHEFERIFGGLFSANRGKSYLMVMCLCVPCGNVFVCAREGGGGGGMAVVERARDRQAETEREHIMGMYLCIDMFVCVCVCVYVYL